MPTSRRSRPYDPEAMSYRDDLAAAHARIETLEAELARVTAAYAELQRRTEELEADAKLGREIRLEREGGFSEERLREKMRREEAEVEAKIRAKLEGDG